MAQTTNALKKRPPYQAVITGDVVQSRQLPSGKFKDVQEALKRGGDELARWFPNRLPLPVHVFRGDSWQLLVSDPGDALRIALYFRAYLRAESGSDTRFAIGVGTVDKQTGASVGEARGEAFRLSGELLDRKSSNRMRFAITNEHADGWWEEESISALFAVLDVIVTRWTGAQSRAVCGALLGWKQERIAETWPGEPITQQAAGQHLARAGWDGTREALEYYEKVLGKWHPL